MRRVCPRASRGGAHRGRLRGGVNRKDAKAQCRKGTVDPTFGRRREELSARDGGGLSAVSLCVFVVIPLRSVGVAHRAVTARADAPLAPGTSDLHRFLTSAGDPRFPGPAARP
jgi:hypothetical protein